MCFGEFRLSWEKCDHTDLANILLANILLLSVVLFCEMSFKYSQFPSLLNITKYSIKSMCGPFSILLPFTPIGSYVSRLTLLVKLAS